MLFENHFKTGCFWTLNGKFNHSNKLNKTILKQSIDGAAKNDSIPKEYQKLFTYSVLSFRFKGMD